MKLIVSLIMMFPIVAFSQEEATFSFEFNNQPVQEVLLIIEKTCKVRFSYQNNYVENKHVTIEKRLLILVSFSISFQYKPI